MTIVLPPTAKLLKSRRALNTLKSKLQYNNIVLSVEPERYPCYLVKAGITASEIGWCELHVVYLYLPE